MFEELAKPEEVKNIILVLQEKPSQQCMKVVTEFVAKTQIDVQLFDILELQYNISKHVLVPKPEVIRDEEEIKNIVARYSIKSKLQFPHILKTDPMSRYLGLKSGDLVKITRVSPSAGEYIVYRCCL